MVASIYTQLPTHHKIDLILWIRRAGSYAMDKVAFFRALILNSGRSRAVLENGNTIPQTLPGVL